MNVASLHYASPPVVGGVEQTIYYEYHLAERAMHPPQAAPIFGWTSAVFIDLAIRASQDAGER